MRNLGLSIPAAAFLLSTVAMPTNLADLTSLSSLPSWISASRPSLAMQGDSTGKLTYCGNNLLTYSSDLTNAVWTKASATITAGTADPVGGTGAFTYTATANGSITQSVASVSLTGNRKFMNSVWLRRRTGTGLVRIYLPASSPQTATLTGTWTQFSATGAGNANGNAYFEIDVTTAGDAIDVYLPVMAVVTYETTPRSQDQVLTTSAAYYAPRLTDYSLLTLANQGALLEGECTNLALNSHMNSGWSPIGCYKTTDGTLDPAGQAALKLSATAGASTHNWFTAAQNTALVSGTQYTYSVYVKAGTHSKVLVNTGDATRYSAATFDISGTSDITASQVASGVDTGVSGKGQYLGNGWFRLCLTFTSGGTGTRFAEVAFIDNLTGNTFTGFGEKSWTTAGTETMYVAMYQVEAGPVATSWVGTDASSKTRSADAWQPIGTALATLQGSAWTVFVEMTSLSSAVTGTKYLLGLMTAQDSPIYISSDTVAGTFSAAGTQTATIGGSGKFSTTARVGASFDANGRSLVANGGAVSNDTGKGYAAVTAAYIGSSNGSSAFAPGWYRSIALFNSRLPDLTTQAKSTVGAPYV